MIVFTRFSWLACELIQHYMHHNLVKTFLKSHLNYFYPLGFYKNEYFLSFHTYANSFKSVVQIYFGMDQKFLDMGRKAKLSTEKSFLRTCPKSFEPDQNISVFAQNRRDFLKND